MTASLQDFPLLHRACQEGIDRRLHTGIQIYVSRGGQTLLNCGFGMATTTRIMDESSLLLWRSAGKPLTAALILKEIENGRLQLTDSLDRLLPEFGKTQLAAVTLFQLMTHTSGFPSAETGWPLSSWSDTISTLVKAELQYPVGTAAYHPQSSWFLLGEILLRTDGSSSDFPSLIRTKLFDLVGMPASSCGLSANQLGTDQPAVPTLYERDKGQLIESEYNSRPYQTTPAPGGSLRGPVSELGRFYEMLLRSGKLADGTSFLSSDTVNLMTSRHRTGLYDETLQHIVDFGLGVIVDSNAWGAETVPYGFSPHCSPRTFGHGGSQCAIGFCDPEAELVVAWAANGFCGEGQHQRRNRAINDAIYREFNSGKIV